MTDAETIAAALERLRGWHRHYQARDSNARIGLPGHLQPGERAHWVTLAATAKLFKSVKADKDPNILSLARAIIQDRQPDLL